MKDLEQAQKTTRELSRCGCIGIFFMKLIEGGIYNVYSFVKEHNHELASDLGKLFVVSNRGLTIAQQKCIALCGNIGI